MKTFMMKTMFAMALVITTLCTSIIPAAAQEASVESEMESCVECGATGYYRGVEYSGWELTGKEPCIHGTHSNDLIYARYVFEVTRCTYCHHLFEKEVITFDIKRECTDS